MPAVNYGQSGANQLGDMPIHPGTYAIRQSTLRSLVADLGGQIAQNGFKWIFVMNGHGAPTHNIAINEACDFVSEAFGVTMLHLTGLFRADAAIQSAERRSTPGTSPPRISPHSAWMFMLVSGDVGHPRYPTRFGSAPVTETLPQPGGSLSGGVANNRDRTRLAGVSVVACQGDGGARPSTRDMVDRRVHKLDPASRARGEHVRPCAWCPRHSACGCGPDPREGTGDRSRIRSQAR